MAIHEIHESNFVADLQRAQQLWHVAHVQPQLSLDSIGALMVSLEAYDDAQVQIAQTKRALK